MKLGDLAYYLFRPVVYLTDWIWDTDMKHCSVCKARRARWNGLPHSGVWTWLIVGVVALIAWRAAH